jgi:lipid II:glycine glycyltransferase (peptidoglycan interpeptide bridge formation enzyme)
MRKNTRYAIRLAEKKGVTIEVSEDISDVKLLYDLQLETSSRHGFVPFSLKYLEAQFRAFSQNHQIQLFKAKYQGRLLAISFIIFYGEEAVYHYSGSSEESRTIPASYLLQWEVIKAAKERGMKRYNLWGVNQSGRSDHRFAGVTLFKTGFGGEALNYVSAHDLVFSKRYFITYLIEAWRRKVRHL